MLNQGFSYFVKRFLFFLFVTGIILLMIIITTNLFGVKLRIIGEYLTMIFIGVVVVFFLTITTGLLFKDSITNLLLRAESIPCICPDENGQYLHIIAQHWHGKDIDDGRESYQHFLIRLRDGKAWISRKMESKDDLSVSLQRLSQRAKVQLNPLKSEMMSIGLFQGMDDLFAHEIMYLPKYRIHITGFDSYFDYGFKLECYNLSDKLVWRRKI